jgi:hypothetical protein
MSVITILKDYYAPAGLAGNRGDKARLRGELEACARLNARLYGLLLALEFFLFFLAIVAVWKDSISGGKHYVGLLAGLGITATGSLEMMRRIGREWSQSRLLLALMGSVSEGELQKFIGKLLDSKQAK